MNRDAFLPLRINQIHPTVRGEFFAVGDWNCALASPTRADSRAESITISVNRAVTKMFCRRKNAAFSLFHSSKSQTLASLFIAEPRCSRHETR